MAFTTSGQETEWALFLQPRNSHGAALTEKITQNISIDENEKTKDIN